jgi:hypothetical protein
MAIKKEDTLLMLELYFESKISKEELSSWAYNCMYDMLRGNIFELEAIALYKIIVLLTQLDDDIQSINEEEMHNIACVLTGKMNTTYNLIMSIPSEHRDKELLYIKEHFLNYQKNHEYNTQALSKLKALLARDYTAPKTIHDLFKYQLSCLISVAYSFHRGRLEFAMSSMVLTNEDKITEGAHLDRIAKLLDCYVDGYFVVCVSYNKGTPNITLVI